MKGYRLLLFFSSGPQKVAEIQKHSGIRIGLIDDTRKECILLITKQLKVVFISWYEISLSIYLD